MTTSRKTHSIDEFLSTLLVADTTSAPLKHVRAHAEMIRLAVRQRAARELMGQALRLVAAGPASAVGKYPAGNIGRARVPATHPMPIADDLAQLLEGAP